MHRPYIWRMRQESVTKGCETVSDIKKNIEKIQNIKADAAMACGRNPEDILLCAVTKTRTAEEINEAVDAGITDIG